MIGWDDAAWETVARIYQNERYKLLSDRLDALLDILTENPGDERVRTLRTRTPAFWGFTVYGSGEAVMILWELDQNGDAFIQYAGDEL